MRACVFVDGENFRFNLLKLFGGDTFKKKDYLPKAAEWGKFFDYIVAKSSRDEAVRLRTYWYVVGAVDSWPVLPKMGTHNNAPKELKKWCAQWEQNVKKHKDLCNLSPSDLIMKLSGRKRGIEQQFEGFRIIHRAISSEHESIEFRHSGAISYGLLEQKLRREKTMDVNLAVDMLQMRDIYDMAIVVSGDQDYLPAIQAVKDTGKTVVNVAFTAQNGMLLPGGARRLNESTDWSLIVDYQALAKFMKLAVA